MEEWDPAINAISSIVFSLHLKDYIYSSSNDINLNDFNKGFEVWEKVANDNGKRVQKGEAIQDTYITIILRK